MKPCKMCQAVQHKSAPTILPNHNNENYTEKKPTAFHIHIVFPNNLFQKVLAFAKTQFLHEAAIMEIIWKENHLFQAPP